MAEQRKAPKHQRGDVLLVRLGEAPYDIAFSENFSVAQAIRDALQYGTYGLVPREEWEAFKALRVAYDLAKAEIEARRVDSKDWRGLALWAQAQEEACT